MRNSIGLCCVALWGSTLGCGAGAKEPATPNNEQVALQNGPLSNEPITPPNGGRVSAVTPPSPTVVDEPTYELFVQKWMAGLRDAVGSWGSFAAYATKTLPSPSGSNEAIEAMQWFNMWCVRHGGTPNGVDGGQALEQAGVPNGNLSEVGRTAGYCMKGGQLVAAVALDPVRVDNGVELWLRHYSQKSLGGLASELGSSALRPTFVPPRVPALPPVPPPASSARAAVAEPASPPPGEVDKIKLEDFSGLSGMRSYVYEHAPADVRALLVKGEYAVFTDSIAFNPSPSGSRYCWGMVGLTRPQSQDRNPRVPVPLTFGFYAANSSEETSDCRATALRIAFDEFFSRTPERMIEKSDFVSAGGKRKIERADPTIVDTFSSTHSGFIPNSYVANNVPREFTQAFDYRRLQLVAISTETHLTGHLVCFALLGVTTPAPENRNPHWPGTFETMVNEIPADEASGAGAGDRCEGAALQRALADLLDQPWDDTGLLKNLNATREDGVVPVRGIAKKNTPVATQGPEAPRNSGGPALKAQGTSVTNLRYECFNGDCVRIFPNGKRERFQAPRCFEPFKQTWEWKPEGC